LNTRYRLLIVIALCLSFLIPAAGRNVRGDQSQILTNLKPSPVTGILDTLRWITDNDTDIYGWTGDYFLQYYANEIDEGILKSIRINLSDLPDTSGGSLTIWIVDSHYNWPEINTTNLVGDSTAWLGYFNTTNGISPFCETGNWIHGKINQIGYLDRQYNPLGNNLWPSVEGMTIPVTPATEDRMSLNIDLESLTGQTLYITTCDTFMILIRLNGFPAGADSRKYRFGSAAGSISHEPLPGLQFFDITAHPNGRLGQQDLGWYILPYAFDWRCAVEIAGDIRPKILEITQLKTTLSTDPQEVNVRLMAYNHCDWTSYDSVILRYSVNDGYYSGVQMSMTPDDTLSYFGSIPGFDVESRISYKAEVFHSSGLIIESPVLSYRIFSPIEKTLFFYDNDGLSSETADSFYFKSTGDLKIPSHDFWQATDGPVFGELIDHYQTVVHVMGSGPANQPDDIGAIYKTWLEGATAIAPRYLFISGQDYGYISDFKDTTFVPGTFEYDYLGIQTLGSQDYPGTEGYKAPWRVSAIADNILTGSYQAFEGDSVRLFYNPYQILGFGAWQDNIVKVPGAVTDFTNPDNNDAPVGIHYEGANWKTVFWTVDWLALSFYDPADTAGKEHWGLTDVGNLLVNVLNWFDPLVTIHDDKTPSPETFALNAIIPNPFNPTTTIRYQLPEQSLVEITAYNLLGQDVKQLVREQKPAGKYSIVWNAENLPSGIYLIRMTAGDFHEVQKCLLLK